MLEAEEKAKAGEAGRATITPEDMDRADREGLLDEANLTIFMTWWQLGGMEHPPTITEIAEMPAALRHDLIYLITEFGRLRRTRNRSSESTVTNKKGRRS